MTTYLVGEGGAVVRWPTGRTTGRPLPPGAVVEGDLEPVAEAPKRRKGYADKRQRVVEDKAL